MMKLFYSLVTLVALSTLAVSHKDNVSPRAIAAEAAPATVSSVTGDLVIDFLGAQRGYVGPCG